MKRTLAIVFIALIITGLLTGCGSTSESVDSTEETVQQEEVETVAGLIVIDYTTSNYGGVRSCIMYDPETYVMYVLVRSGTNATSVGGLSVMYNADGTVKLYDPSKE